MKNIKKLLSIVMVLAMVLSLGVSALADVTVSLPKNTEDGTSDYDGHTMVAYKIFEGTMNSDQEGSRSDPEGINGVGKAALGVTGWADGIDYTRLLTYLSTASEYAGKTDKDGKPITFSAGMSAWDAAMAISNLSQTEGFDAVKFSQTVAKYINKGTATKKTFDGGAAQLSSGYWIIVDETPESAQGANFSYSAYLLEVVGNTNLQLADKVDIPTVEKKVNNVDSDVAGLNEIVEFTITATLPEDYAKYDSYYLAFIDTMDDTLDYVNDPNVPTRAAFITWPDETTTDVTTLDWKTGATGKVTFKHEISDLKTAKSGLSAGDEIVLTFYAKVTVRTLIRTYNNAHIEYSNNPNNVGEPHGHTPDDRVIVFTFTFNGNKVDQDGNPLPGAKFTLYKEKEDGTKDVFETPDDGAKATVTYKGTEYTLYRNEKEAESDGKGNFKFDFSQLGEGKYLLVETTVPAGYNQMDDYPFSVEMTKDSEGNITGARVLDSNGDEITDGVTIVFPEDPKTGYGTGTGTVEQDIKNRSGLELPETGGMGTTIFYVVGAILVVGAVILLVTRKRVNGASK